MSVEIINSLGFQYDSPIDVQGCLSIADKFPKSKSRCGIYLLNFSDDTFYIGQAIDVVRRFAQHRKSYENIKQLWFQPTKKEKLDEIEQGLINKAETKGLLLTNITFVSNIIGDTDLDLIISSKEQNIWLEKDTEIPNGDYDLYSKVEKKHIVKNRHKFEKLKQADHYLQLKRILNIYIKRCLPAFKKTEKSFWALSCLPSTNKTYAPRDFCMSVNAMEVFVSGFSRYKGKPFSFICLAQQKYFHKNDEIKRLSRKYKTLKVNERLYRAAGADQFQLYFSDLNELEDILLTEPTVVNSIKELNLRLMRKGGTIYSPYHCFDLAKDILSHVDKPQKNKLR